MMKNNLFTPIDGVIVEIQKETNTAGIELPENSKKRNEGIIISDNIFFTPKKIKEINFNNRNIEQNELQEEMKNVREVFDKGVKIKFTEGYELEDNLLFVPLDKIIGIFTSKVGGVKPEVE